jgi:integrase
MSKAESNPSVHVERCIFYRRNAAGQKVYEIRWRDSTGRYCRRAVGTKITAARAERDKELAKRGRNEPAAVNPRLSFGEAADGFLANRVADLRTSTRAGYEWAIESHLRPRFGTRRLDRLSADDWAAFIRDLRDVPLAEGSIESVLKAARGVYSYAARRLDWHGRDTLALLDRAERPKPSDKVKRRLFSDAELAATLRAAVGQNRLIFATAGTVGSRISETLGLIWGNLDLDDLDAASISFTHQVDRKGNRVPLKTEESKRTIELPRSLAAMLAEHKAGSQWSKPGDFVFATRSGRALGQRNVSRELRATMKAATLDNGRPAFPILSETDDQDEPVKVERGDLPSFHSFRHSAASNAIAAGDGVEETSWMLGHKDSTVTRRVYISEVRTVERSAKRRGRLEARMGGVLSALGEPKPSRRRKQSAEVISLDAKRQKAAAQ